MRIGCLQFAPRVGDVDDNLNRADAVLSKVNPGDFDLLVLPEMAFSGYNFKSQDCISPLLEPNTSGISSLWARARALKYECIVTLGYPEKSNDTQYYNSTIVVDAKGETIAKYRKVILSSRDKIWALKSQDEFFDGGINGLGNAMVAIGIDLDWDFSKHILWKEANLIILSMAWCTDEDPRLYSRTPYAPDLVILDEWLRRLEPVIREEREGEVIVVIANRTGTEDEAVYTGTSVVLGIQGGTVSIYGILGRGEKELLVVDTKRPPKWEVQRWPKSLFEVGTDPELVDSTPPPLDGGTDRELVDSTAPPFDEGTDLELVDFTAPSLDEGTYARLETPSPWPTVPDLAPANTVPRRNSA